MDVVILCVLLVALAAFVAAPLYRQSSADIAPGGPDGSAVAARRRAAEAALDDLEVDRASGLLDADEYTRERAPLQEEVERLPDAP